MKTRDLILSLSKDEAKISCFFSILLGIDMNRRRKGLRERRLTKRSLLRLLGRIACNPPPCQRRPNTRPAVCKSISGFGPTKSVVKLMLPAGASLEG